MDAPLLQNDSNIIGFDDAELAFIKQHKQDDVNQLILKSNTFKGIDVKKLAGQILSRQKALKKLPEWSANDALIFPPALSVEQCSSEATACYKASVISGNMLIDITGGMGVDSYYISRNFDKTHYFEQQEEVAVTAAYNFNVLKAEKIEVHHNDSLSALEQNNFKADWIYADPARRGINKEKVVRLADCTPDMVANLDLLLQTAPDILLKTSPLLDIDLAVKELKHVKEVHITGYDQECKELLFHINRDFHSDDFLLKVRILNVHGEILQSLDFDRNTERNSEISYSYPLSYLYEPHATVLKAGAFKIPGPLYQVKKLAASSHLYTSDEHITNFPGRAFEIVGVCKPDIQEILTYIKESKANLTLRNFPAKIQDLRKKWRLKDGGDFYLFATTLFDNKKVIIITKKIEK